ncbi:MAG: MFS transporter, partial [Pseudomonadota bacterium]
MDQQNIEEPLRPLTTAQLYTVAFAIISMGIGLTVSFVVASPLARDAGLTELEVAGILTLSAFFFALLTPAWGRLANRFGRKRIMVFSLYAMGLTNAAFILALDAALQGVIVGTSAFLVLVFVRLAFGVLSPGLQPAAFAAVTDATTRQNRAAGLGLLGAAMSVGSILGPAGAAVLAEFGGKGFGTFKPALAELAVDH